MWVLEVHGNKNPHYTGKEWGLVAIVTTKKSSTWGPGHGRYLACMQLQSSCRGPEFLNDKQPHSAEITCLGQ